MLEATFVDVGGPEFCKLWHNCFDEKHVGLRRPRVWPYQRAARAYAATVADGGDA
jgi:hypothetical protein